MTLTADVLGRPGAPTIALVHGFTQNARCWGPLLEALARDHRVVAVDAPGHGRSPAVHDAAGIAEAAALIGEVGGPATYLGYSMGGRLCLRLACDRPDLVQRLVLVGATPGLRDPDARRQRRLADEALASRLLEVGLAAFLDGWLSLPLFAGLRTEQRHLAARLRNRPEGVAASLRACGTGCQEPLWSRLPALPMPVLLTAGALDAKFAAVAAAMAAALRRGAPGRPAGAPEPELHLVEGAGHTAHLEQPDAFLALLRDWSSRTAAP